MPYIFILCLQVCYIFIIYSSFIDSSTPFFSEYILLNIFINSCKFSSGFCAFTAPKFSFTNKENPSTRLFIGVPSFLNLSINCSLDPQESQSLVVTSIDFECRP
eukprot:Sdes_comp17222_c0_seq1m6400